MELRCRFIDFTFAHGEKFYGCKVENHEIPKNVKLHFVGLHEAGKTDDDVHYVMFSQCHITEIPKGLTKNFWRMKVLDIDRSKLRKIDKKDLIEYKNLEKFICYKNELEFLPGDLFENFENLEFIDFCGNDLRIIEPNLLNGLENLKNVNFGSNSKYNKFYSVYPIYNPNAILTEIRSQLVDNFFTFDNQNADNFLKKFQNPIEMLKIFSKRATTTVAKSVILEFKLNFMEEKIENLTKNLENEKLEKSAMAQNFQDQVDSLSSQLHKGVLSDLKKFIQNDKIKDFKIKIADREFLVNKFLLVARSPTLAETLSQNPEAENLNLLDVSVETFEIVLKFLYTDDLPSGDRTNFLHLFAAAGRLKIEELKKFAGMKLKEQINAENSYEIFKLGSRYNHEEIKKKAFEKIKEKYPKIQFKDEWMAEPAKILKVIEIFKKKEEAMKKIEMEFEDILTK